VKQVIPGTIAACDGRMKRGDRILSVNGHSTSSLTNKEALQVLKDSGSHVTIFVSRKIGRQSSLPATPMTSTLQRGQGSSHVGSRKCSKNACLQCSKQHQTLKGGKSTLPRKIKGGMNGVYLVEVYKGPTGLGLQLQGSTDASMPIKVKAVLSGGPAFKSGKICVGNEIIEVNGVSFESLSQQEALKVMKDLPQGKVSIILRDHLASSSTD